MIDLMDKAFLSNDEAAAFFRRKVDSGRWWVIIPRGRAGHDLVQAFENQFYAGDTSIGFEVMVLPSSALREEWTGAVMIAFALKQYCSPSRLAEWLARRGRAATAEALAAPDLHFW